MGNFCGECGTSIDTTSAKFCSQCGFKLITKDNTQEDPSLESKSNLKKDKLSTQELEVELRRYLTHKSYGGNPNPLTCRLSSAHSQRGAVAAPTIKGANYPTPMCSSCWNKFENELDKFEPSPIIMSGDITVHQAIRVKIAIAKGIIKFD